jgi:hypothetical protein
MRSVQLIVAVLVAIGSALAAEAGVEGKPSVTPATYPERKSVNDPGQAIGIRAGERMSRPPGGGSGLGRRSANQRAPPGAFEGSASHRAGPS